MAGGSGYAERERTGALNFARMARREGVKRVIYLGGLGDESKSKHRFNPSRPGERRRRGSAQPADVKGRAPRSVKQ